MSDNEEVADQAESSAKRRRTEDTSGLLTDLLDDNDDNDAADKNKDGAESDSSSSKSAVEDDTALRADKDDTALEGIAETKLDEDENNKRAESDSSSSSSSSSSASSTSSSSSSSSSTEEEIEEIEEQIIVQEEDEDEAPEEAIELVEESPEKRRERDYQVCCGAQLRRKDLLHLLQKLPRQEAEKAIKRAWVRITIQGGNVLAQVTDLEDVEAYSVLAGSSSGTQCNNKASDRPSSIKVALKCRRCVSERTYKLVNISNQEISIQEFEAWIKLTEKHGLDYAVFRPVWKEKARDIYEARNFTFDDKVVAEMLRRKKSMGIDVEFDAQKESRLRAELQGSRTQMELCGLRDSRATEVEQRYNNGIIQIEELYRRSAKLQETWFEKRPNLYSLKEINMKNKNRQTARDKHALNYTYALEDEAALALAEGRTVLSNPFERRPCRPVGAWDTKLTETEGLEHVRALLPQKASEAKADESGKPESSEPTTNGAVKDDAPMRVDRRAHRDLLSMMSKLMASGTSSSDVAAASAS